MLEENILEELLKERLDGQEQLNSLQRNTILSIGRNIDLLLNQSTQARISASITPTEHVEVHQDLEKLKDLESRFQELKSKVERQSVEVPKLIEEKYQGEIGEILQEVAQSIGENSSTKENWNAEEQASNFEQSLRDTVSHIGNIKNTLTRLLPSAQGVNDVILEETKTKNNKVEKAMEQVEQMRKGKSTVKESQAEQLVLTRKRLIEATSDGSQEQNKRQTTNGS